MREDTVNLLKECNSGITMGMSSINNVLPYVKNPDLKSALISSKEKHAKLGERTHKALAMYDESRNPPHVMAKMMADAKVKTYMFSMDERTDMARLACEDLPNVTVISSTARLIDLVDELGADVIVKGVRNEADYAYEQQHALYNRAHNPKAETLYLPADPSFDHISSTLARERIAAGQGIDDLVPAPVAAYIREREN